MTSNGKLPILTWTSLLLSLFCLKGTIYVTMILPFKDNFVLKSLLTNLTHTQNARVEL